MTISVFDRDAKKITTVDKGNYLFEGNLEGFTVSWSADSRWITYARDLPATQHSAVFVYDTRANARTQVTSGFYDDHSPVFDPDGKYVYFESARHFDPSYSAVDNTWIYANATNVMAAALRADVPSPLAARDDEEGAAAPAKPKADSSKTPAPVGIDLDGFEARAVALPVPAGNYGELLAVAGKVLYRRFGRTGADDHKSPLLYWDLKDRKEETVIDDADGVTLSANGEKLLVAQGGKFAILDIKPAQKFEKPLATSGLTMVVDPKAEWQQIFNDVWRFERDYFYDPHTHGVDWNAERADYQKLLDASVTRWDVNFVIGELISELSSSHTYRGGGDAVEGGRRGVGLLGVDFVRGESESPSIRASEDFDDSGASFLE